jgi:hypothetical protein
MRLILLITSPWIVLLLGCPGAANVQCAEDGNCNRFAGGLCRVAPSGQQWCSYPDPACPSGYRYSDLDVGDGLEDRCVMESDAGEPDAAPVMPIVESGQPADLVLGQETFTAMDENHGGRSARSLSAPAGVVVDDTGRLWVLDVGNDRALMWSAAPQVSFAGAALVVGSPDFTSTGGPCLVSTSFCAFPVQIGAKGGKLVIPADGHRVLIWNPVPVTNGAPASTVLGQLRFDDSAPGDGAADLNVPLGAWTDGRLLAVADTGNNRVLIWTTFPTTNKQPADIVLGQPGFGSSDAPRPPTGGTMRGPTDVYSDGERFFVADSGNSRVLVWRVIPTRNGQPADFAIGQPNLTSNEVGQGASQLRGASGVTTVGDHLFVSDPGNHRILVFSPLPNASGAPAYAVLGQPSFETSGAGTTRATLRSPGALAADGNKLYVTDGLNNRVLRFGLRL